ncbi:hypothetical protein KC678_00435 [Candidatus Dojkabacteria bacterium]|uniref:Uncharacterized protein n=1 Tax=Candidatus Dojkabacteria bacterium TaxID=2099670 RepID=A0A955L1G4_9BACT|nr:hypothetical protein [Candidatus Dojkabacteria bacterium]
MANIFTKTLYLDNNLEALPDDYKPEKGAIYVTKKVKRNAALRNSKFAEQVINVSVHKDDQKIDIGNEILYRSIAHGYKAEDILETGLKLGKGKESPSFKFKMNQNIALFALAFGLVGIICALVMFFAIKQNKNFSDEVFTFYSPTELSEGEYVTTDAEIWDGYYIEIEDEYGSKTEGNFYALFSKPLDEINDEDIVKPIETFIFRMSPKSDYRKTIDALGDDEYIIYDLSGEVKNLSKIENVETGLTADESFRQTIDEINSYGEADGFSLANPIIMIDGVVKQANLIQDVVLPSGAVGLVGAALIGVYFMFNKKYNSQLNKFMEMVKHKGKSSPIEKN